MPNQPPPIGTYKFVLRTWRGYDPTIPRLAAAYDESCQSLDITHPDGVRHPTIFVNTEPARDRFVKTGWKDVSAEWFEWVGQRTEDAPVAEPEAPARRRVSIRA